MRTQQVTISIKYDETQFDEPSSWDWNNVVEGIDKISLLYFGAVWKAENEI
jgi:hypothetical protein